MEVRLVKPEERLAAAKVDTIAFLGTMDPTYKEDFANPDELDPPHGELWAAFDDRDKLVSALHVHDMKMRFDGHIVGMGGIGGVSTLPEARVGGFIRRVNETIMPLMRERGMVFSFLFPWSFAFYRKFGYELCYAPNRLRVPMDFFRQYPFPGGITMHEPGDDTAPFLAVYEQFTRDKNLALERGADAMRRKVDKDPYLTKTYAYLHRDGGGQPDAYLCYKADEDHGDDGNTLRVNELAWTTPEGLHAMFGFIGGLAPQFGNLRWDAPSGFNVFPLFVESYEISCARPARGMNRVLHAPDALQLMRAPQTPGKAVIQVADAFMPVNDGVYALEWEAGRVTSVKTGGGAADLETDIETLAQLITGFLTPDEARLKRGVKINGNEAALRALFPHKDTLIMDHF